MSLFKTLKEISKNPFRVADQEPFPEGTSARWIDTGSYIFNAILSGSIYKGLPGLSITCLAGEEATGKSFFLLGIMKNFLEMDPTAQAILFETEGALQPETITERGIDPSRLLINRADTVQGFSTDMINYLTKIAEMADKPPLFFGLDSLGMLSTDKELEEMLKGSGTKDMTRAQLIKAAFRAFTSKLEQLGAPLVITNHTYTVVGSMYASKEMSGGGGPKYAGSTIVYLSKRKEKDKTTNEVIGEVIHCYVEKSRTVRSHRQVDVLLTYDGGLHRYYGLDDLAAKYGIFKKLDTRLEMPDGKKIYRKALLADPETYYTKEVLDRIDEAAFKEFKFGKGEAASKEVEENE